MIAFAGVDGIEVKGTGDNLISQGFLQDLDPETDEFVGSSYGSSTNLGPVTEFTLLLSIGDIDGGYFNHSVLLAGLASLLKDGDQGLKGLIVFDRVMIFKGCF